MGVLLWLLQKYKQPPTQTSRYFVQVLWKSKCITTISKIKHIHYQSIVTCKIWWHLLYLSCYYTIDAVYAATSHLQFSGVHEVWYVLWQDNIYYMQLKLSPFRGAGLAQWWECLPPINVAWVQLWPGVTSGLKLLLVLAPPPPPTSQKGIFLTTSWKTKF